MRKPSTATNPGSVSKQINTAYDKMVEIQENLPYLLSLSDGLEALSYYLGAHEEDPTTGYEGAPLISGNYYLNTVENSLRFYDADEVRWIEFNPEYMEQLRDEAEASNLAAGVAQAAAELAQAAAEAARDEATNQASFALTSANNAANSAIAASNSETNAAASELAAKLSEDAAEVSETNAAASETAAGISETNASTSETNAAASELAAATSETNASVSAAAALASENAAALSETNASTSETNAATSETNAALSAVQAAIDAQRAEDAATAAESALIPRGDWDASAGLFPTPSLAPERADFYQISVAGLMTDTNPDQPDVDAGVGDQLYWHVDKDIWYKIDNTDAVNSVDGQQGDVVVDKYTQAEVDAIESGLQSNIIAEETARIAADGVLQGNIDAEQTVREAADTTLQTNIDAKADDYIVVKYLSADGPIDVNIGTTATRPDTSSEPNASKAFLWFNNTTGEAELYNPSTGEWGAVGGGGLTAITEVSADFTIENKKVYGIDLTTYDALIATVPDGLPEDAWFTIVDNGNAFDDTHGCVIQLGTEYFTVSDTDNQFFCRKRNSSFTFQKKNGKWVLAESSYGQDATWSVDKIENGYTDWEDITSDILTNNMGAAYELVGRWEDAKTYRIKGIMRSTDNFASGNLLQLPKSNRLSAAQFVPHQFKTQADGQVIYVNTESSILVCDPRSAASNTFVVVDTAFILED